MTNAEIAERNPAQSIGLIEDMFPAEHRATIARFLGVKDDEPALPAFLAFCAQWQLDPFAGQIWLIKQKGRDGEGRDRYRPAAGRDGFLAIANRQSDFIGVVGDVVRANDIYGVKWEEDEKNGGMKPNITHEYEQRPAQGEEEERKTRGVIMGAWARVDRRDRSPQYFFAPLDEHVRDKSKSAWSYTSAMILKSAYSMALRLTYSITGAVPIDEMHGDNSIGASETEGHDVGAITSDEVIDAEGTLHDNPELAERLKDAVAIANEQEPGSWLPAKLQMMLRGREEDGVEALIAQIEDENSARQAAIDEAEGVTDAEVVPDDEPEEKPAEEEKPKKAAAKKGKAKPKAKAAPRDPHVEPPVDPDNTPEESEEAELERVKKINDLAKQRSDLLIKLDSAAGEEREALVADVNEVEKLLADLGVGADKQGDGNAADES